MRGFLHHFKSGISPLKQMTPKSVAIIGAGPGGLVAAKTLLRSCPNGSFHVTIFEKSDRIGGIWSITKNKPDGIVPIEMPTNLSQFAVSFSDLAWSGLHLPGGLADMHPKAWQVNAYLEEYVRRYDLSASMRLGTTITGLEENDHSRWLLTGLDTAGSQFKQSFDFCISASGFYSKALPLQCELDGFGADKPAIKLVHSSLYRSLDDILPEEPNKGKILLVIGGANSGGEAAAALAFDLSNARYKSGGEEHGYRIIHIVPKPVYGLPLIVPSAGTPGTFVPLDVRFYDLSTRSDQPLSLNVGIDNQDKRKMMHGLLQGMLGTDPYETGHYKPVSGYKGNLPGVKAAIQDNWASFVRSGAIQILVGRVTTLHGHGSDAPISATIRTPTNDESTTVDNIAGVIYATGYTPEPALDILSQKTKDLLHHEPSTPRLPLLLPEDILASHPAVPNLGFVGLYEGPYWGVMEMQARHLAARWSSTKSPSPDLLPASRSRLDSLQEIRTALKNTPDLVPQYIFSDYTAIMEESARTLNLIRNDDPWQSTEGPITPSRYLDVGSSRSESDLTISSLKHLIEQSKHNARFVPHCVFRGLLGKWTIHRELKSQKEGWPTGTFEGEAWFHPRRPETSNNKNNNKERTEKEYLYLESGTLKTDAGLEMSAYKSYAWRLSSQHPEQLLSVWFTKPDSRTVDYLYHNIIFDTETGPQMKAENGKEAGNGLVVWKAKAEHLCERDMYRTEYSFVFDGVAVREYGVVHAVKGPEKDYVSWTVYKRS